MVRAARRNWLAASTLSGIGPLSRTGISSLSGFHSGSLVVEEDSRHLAVQHYHSLKDKLNIASSFDPKSMHCVTCTESHVLLTDTQHPVCLVLSDQNFCPFVPAKRGEKCPLVVRAEDGMLGDLEGIFKDVFRDYCKPKGCLPQGSVILVGSLSHLSLLGITSYVEDLVRVTNSLISLTGPGVSVCPLVTVPLSGISDSTTIAQLANFDSWVISNKMAPSISLPVSRDRLWEVLCKSASTFVKQGPRGESLYLPMSLTNARKRRFTAGALEGPFPVTIDPLDAAAELEVVCALTKELNDCYCLSLPTDPLLERHSKSPARDLSEKRLVIVGSSHAGRMSALVSASLETTFLKLPHQSQTPNAAEDLADQIELLGLGKDDIIYLDLLSNTAYMGTDAEGNSTEPTKVGKGWHIPGSLVAAARPRLRKQLDKLSAILRACGEASVICGLPTPRYVSCRCCEDPHHLDNVLESEMAEVHSAVRANSKACLLAAVPSCRIFDPMTTFACEEELGELSALVSSGGVSIWKEGDPVHLTETAYGDIAENLTNSIRQGDSGGLAAEVPRRRLESVVTRSAADPAHTPLPGWLVGGNQGAQRGRGQARGALGGRGFGRGKPATWRGGPGGRWAPY